MLKFLENYDLMYLSMIGFSTILFTYVITKTVLEIRRFVKKEKAITKLEKKYDNLRQHRENLIHHYYWAKADGEMQTLENIKDQLIEVDEDLEILRERFEETKEQFSRKNK